jgi:hypothetical protein
MKQKILLICLIFLLSFAWNIHAECENKCYTPNDRRDNECPVDEGGQNSYTLHMSVHPHLDAYWIFNL